MAYTRFNVVDLIDLALRDHIDDDEARLEAAEEVADNLDEAGFVQLED